MDTRVPTLEAHDRTVAARLAALEARVRYLELQAERTEAASRAAVSRAAWSGREERPPGVDERGCWSGTNNSYGEY